MRSNITRLAILAALSAISGPAPAQPLQTAGQGLTGFLEHIGGSTDIRLLDRGDRPAAQPTARFVGNNEVIGIRYFRSNSHDADGLGDAKRAQTAFASECLATGGTVEGEDSSVTKRQLAWASADLPANDSRGLVEYQAIVSVCTRAGLPTGGMVALVEDHTDFVRNSPVGSVMSIIAPIHNRTAVYAFKASALVSQATIDRQDRQFEVQKARQALEEQRLAAGFALAAQEEQRRLMAWRKTITIGTRTSCGLVIDQRGPLVQIQLPADTTFDGTREHWVERSNLNDKGSTRECQF